MEVLENIGIDQLPQAVERILAHTVGGRNKLVFSGELGAGKTTFIQALCRKLGVEEAVNSPTFSIINEYSYFDGALGSERPVYHMDLYRLRHIEEALEIGIEEYLYGPDWCLIEWPEVIESILPDEVLRIKFELATNSTRKILIL
ncbi:MAG: tRNA (adenosine(37)-N6)-threonylcarbamoyltransferase complex ATPase subunit type 1 TsaE [Saprospiraceae bacterium]|nr:MAG: tRNA (adenosine(37)-N6)-threonylcarbamoyltransferase complex ATPase subunit type 1 TsaE [Saprospiraceae bacterium]